jgi:hypothetical protein
MQFSRHGALSLALLTLVLGFTVADTFAADDATGQQWYKGNLHTHSLWSDGNDFPEMIVDWYASRGYNFLALSDHNILSTGEKWIDETRTSAKGAIGGLKRYQERFGDWVETREQDGKKQVRLKTLTEFRPKFDKPGQFLLIQGEEVTDGYSGLPIHINASNVRDVIKPQGGDSVRERIAKNLIAIEQQSRAVGRPILGHLNHPNFGFGVTAEDMANVVQERYFEVYNGHPSVHHLGDEYRPGVERMWDIANTIRIADMKSPPLFGLGSDDSHNYFGLRGASPGRGWVMVRSPKLEADEIIRNLQAGNFYASSGVTLHDVKFDEATGVLTLDIAGDAGATYVTEFIGTPKDYDKSNSPLVDSKGKEIRATRKYSADVGQTLARVEGTKPSYKLTGNELYVRATITSSLPPENPVWKEQKQQAWTQPVGWQKYMETEKGSGK